MGSIKKQPKCVKYWNMLAIKGLYLDISDWFWLFGRSKYNNYYEPNNTHIRYRNANTNPLAELN